MGVVNLKFMWYPVTLMDRVLREAVAAAGGLRPLARKLGITAQAIHKWEHCPPRRVIAVESATGVPREQLRPDLYPPKAKK